MTTADDAVNDATGTESAPALPSFPKRIIQVFFSPGDLTEALAKNPAWAAALILGAILIVGQTALIPVDVWESMFRETLLQQGREIPPELEGRGGWLRMAGVASGGIGYLLMTLIFAGVATLVFAFVMGDEGKFRQYLAVLAHASLIPAVIGFALLYPKIALEDLAFTINLGTFFSFLPEGYLLKVLTMLDLSQAWAWLVLAQGAHAIDRRRSFASAATVLMVLFVVRAMILAIWAPMPG